MDLFCRACFFPQFLRTFIETLGFALSALIFVRVVLSWVRLPLPAGLSHWVFQVTEPVIAPIRRALPAQMGLDFSPFVALVLIGLVQQALLNVLFRVLYGL